MTSGLPLSSPYEGSSPYAVGALIAAKTLLLERESDVDSVSHGENHVEDCCERIAS